MKKKLLILALVLLAGFSFVGCSKKEEKKKEEEKKEEKKEENKKKKSEEIKNKLVSDDKKIVFKQEPATYIVYYYEKDNITSYAEYIDYVNPADAEKAVKGYDEDMKNKRYESVKAEGQYVVVTHNKTEFDGWTLDAVKQAHKNLKEVKA